MNQFDVIIIGGGPSGALCGIALQKAGFRTCVIDKSVFPREKLCGGLLTQKSIDLLNLHCPELDFSKLVLEEVDFIELYNHYDKVVEYKVKYPYRLTDRKIFDYLLISEYKNKGGFLFENARIAKESIDVEQSTIKIGTDEFHYRILIGADGCNSVVSKKFSPKRMDYFCLEGVQPKRPDEKRLSIHFGCANVGYGWYFPKKTDYVIGVIGDNHHREIQSQAEAYFSKVASEKFGNVKGAFIPSGQKFYYLNTRSNVLLVGDAAGFIDPVTGEGLYYAMLSGILAAKAVMKAVENGSADYLDEYKQLTKNIRNEVKAAYRLQQLFYSRFFYKQIFRSLAKHKNFGLFYIDEVMSTYHYRYRNFIFQYFLKERRKRTN